MVCVYCGNGTSVINSRLTSTTNHVWRRRKCLVCKAIFTTEESADMTAAFRVGGSTSLQPFSRDKLFMSIHSSLGHRKNALSDAAALARTIIGKVGKAQAQPGVIGRSQLADITLQTLKDFDMAAATHYAAYHPEK